MSPISTLAISGYLNKQVPNTFYQQEEGTTHLAILFPGWQYTCQMPLFYYTTKLLLTLEADVLWVEYRYNKMADFQALSNEEQEHWFQADIKAVCRKTLEQGHYPNLTIIGKSLGSRAMGYLLLKEASFAQAKAIWLTPLLKNEKLRQQIDQVTQHSLFIVGGADPHNDPAYLGDVLAAKKGEVLTIEGGNHDLEIEDDIFRTLKAIEDAIRSIQTFLRG